ncbi:FadR/GntR family transcriptional regulator [Paenarthrobacter sp. AMU7]|uniref:FadR/GntR family transcriptional regulator n=1 Tax=Paenarthrobacter sp. AMU7 TaxID=3162492 RepID=A0AB39YPA8_9MICC
MSTLQSTSRSLAAVFSPIKSGGLVEEVCQRVEAAVETGLLASGQRLPNETELASALGVSVITAREALSQLRGYGIIRTARGRNGGSFIADDVLPSPERALERLRRLTRLEIGDMRLHYTAIAATCARLAARRAGASDIEVLRSFVQPDEDAGPLAWRLADSEFLLEVAAIARSARLARELLRIQADFGSVTLLPFTDSEHRLRSVGLRAAVADAIADHRPEVAESCTNALIDASIDWLLAEQAKQS